MWVRNTGKTFKKLFYFQLLLYKSMPMSHKQSFILLTSSEALVKSNFHIGKSWINKRRLRIMLAPYYCNCMPFFSLFKFLYRILCPNTYLTISDKYPHFQYGKRNLSRLLKDSNWFCYFQRSTIDTFFYIKEFSKILSKF